MANIQRLVKNTCLYDQEVKKVFNSIAEKADTNIDCLGATTPIPNQVFASKYNSNGEFAKIFFMEKAYKQLSEIREIDHLCSSSRMSRNKRVNSIKFVCYGYQDFDGDIVITSIDCPIIRKAYSKKFKNKESFYDFIATETISKEFNHEASYLMYDYLKDVAISQPAIGNSVVALLGYTKPETDKDYDRCFKLSEIAEAVIPNVTVRSDNIKSGVIAITPKTLKASLLYNKSAYDNIDKYLEDGSLECALISYSKNPKTGQVVPTTIQDIKKASAETKDKQIDLKISASLEPTEKLYVAKQLLAKKQPTLSDLF